MPATFEKIAGMVLSYKFHHHELMIGLNYQVE